VSGLRRGVKHYSLTRLIIRHHLFSSTSPLSVDRNQAELRVCSDDKLKSYWVMSSRSMSTFVRVTRAAVVVDDIAWPAIDVASSCGRMPAAWYSRNDCKSGPTSVCWSPRRNFQLMSRNRVCMNPAVKSRHAMGPCLPPIPSTTSALTIATIRFPNSDPMWYRQRFLFLNARLPTNWYRPPRERVWYRDFQKKITHRLAVFRCLFVYWLF